MSLNTSSPGGSENAILAGSHNNVRGSYGGPLTTEPVIGCYIIEGSTNSPYSDAFPEGYDTNPVPSDNSYYGGIHPHAIFSSGTYADATSTITGRKEWQWLSTFTWDPMTGLFTWTGGPTCTIISNSNYYPAKPRYKATFSWDMGGNSGWNPLVCSAAQNIQLFISTYGDGSHLVDITPPGGITNPTVMAGFSGYPALPGPFVRWFNPIELLGSASAFYAGFKISGLPSNPDGAWGGMKLELAHD